MQERPVEAATHSDGRQGLSQGVPAFEFSLKVGKNGLGADRPADAKAQRHEETLCISGVVTSPGLAF